MDRWNIAEDWEDEERTTDRRELQKVVKTGDCKYGPENGSEFSEETLEQ